MSVFDGTYMLFDGYENIGLEEKRLYVTLNMRDASLRYLYGFPDF